MWNQRRAGSKKGPWKIQDVWAYFTGLSSTRDLINQFLVKRLHVVVKLLPNFPLLKLGLS